MRAKVQFASICWGFGSFVLHPGKRGYLVYRRGYRQKSAQIILENILFQRKFENQILIKGVKKKKVSNFTKIVLQSFPSLSDLDTFCNFSQFSAQKVFSITMDTTLMCKSTILKRENLSTKGHGIYTYTNIARIANAVHCHSWLSGNKDCHEFRFIIVRIVISVSNVTNLFDCSSSVFTKEG